MEKAYREKTFEEEAKFYEEEARAEFAKETGNDDSAGVNNILRRGMRIIRKARQEIASRAEVVRKPVRGYEGHYVVDKFGREKLIELLSKAHSISVEASAFDDATYAQQLEMESDFLIENGVTFATDTNDGSKWIPVTERLPDNFVSVLGYMTDAGDFPPVRECYTVGNAFFFPALGDIHPVSHWCEMPRPPKEVDNA